MRRTVNMIATYFAFKFIDRIGRRRLTAIGATIDWLANVVLILLAPMMLNGMGLGWVMVLFAALSVLAILFRGGVPAGDQGAVGRRDHRDLRPAGRR